MSNSKSNKRINLEAMETSLRKMVKECKEKVVENKLTNTQF